MSLLDSLVSYWRMDEASGDAIDYHGTNDLIEVDSVGSDFGIIGNSRTTSADASFEHSGSTFDGSSSFSISFWLYVASLDDYYSIVRAGDYSWTLSLYSSIPTLDVLANGYDFVAASNSVSESTWHHIVIWYNADTDEIGISLDNNKNAVELTQNFPISDDLIFIDFLIGRIDECGFWRRVLSPEDIESLYNNGNGLAFENFNIESSGEKYPKLFIPRRHSIYRR